VRIAAGDRTLRVRAERKDELGALAGAFNEMTEHVQGMVDTLEDRVSQRTRDLETTAEISRAISAVRDMDVLLRQVTELICERYGYYHSQVFLVDDVGESAILRASTGEVGKLLLERGHKLGVGSQSVIGQVTGTGQYVVAHDTDTSMVHRRNELLPDTRSELAMPLRVGDSIIGALDVQSVESEAFDEATIGVLQVVADQLSVAVHNARLFEESQVLLREQMQLSQMLTREGWSGYSGPESEVKGFTYDLSDIHPLDDEESGKDAGLKVPIQLRGAMIGELVSLPGEQDDWDEEERLLVEAVADRVALALENARLFEQTQESLQEIGRLYQAGRAFVEADDLDELLQAMINSSIRSWVDRIAVVMVSDIDLGFERAGADVRVEWYRDDAMPRSPQVPLSSAMLPLLTRIQHETRVVADVETDDELDMQSRAALQGFGDKTGIYLPLLTSAGKVLGWLMVAATRSTVSLNQDEMRYYQTIADQAGTAIDSYRLFEQTQQRALKLQATNAVSQAATSILDIEALLPQVVELIRDNFGFYHAQVFLVDEDTGQAVLRASTGDVGKELMARGHMLEVGSQSVIGRVTEEGVPVIARNTDADVVHRRNELLPDTRAEMAIPLRHGARVIGALDVQSTRVYAFADEDIVILQTLADQLAVALENAQLFQDVQERVAELTTVNLISQEVSQAHTLDALFHTVGNQLLRAFEAPDGFLVLYNRENNQLQYPIFLEGGELIEVEPDLLEAGPVARVIETGAPVVLNENVAQTLEEMGGYSQKIHAKSWLGVPLTIGNQVIGVLGVQDMEHEQAYDYGHQRMLSTLAAYLAVAVRNAQLFEETEQRVADLGFLFDVTASALASTDFDQTLQRIADGVADELDNAEATVVALMDAGGQALVPRAAAGYGKEVIRNLKETIPLDTGIAGWAAAEGKPVLVGDVRQDPRYVSAASQTMSEVVVPMMVGDEVVGVLLVESSKLHAFGEDDVRLLQTLSGGLSAIVQNARLLEEIREANDLLRELDKMKSQFLANMSHELRTPLNSIIGFSRVILKGIDGPLTELQEQDLNTIYSSGQHLLGLINDVLDMSKIEAGKLDLAREDINLYEVFDGVMSTSFALVKDKPVKLVKDVPPDLPTVTADPMRIRQVLLNLLSNAAKFTNEGSITLQAVEVEETEDEIGYMQVNVIDTGIGISEEDIEKLFEAFSQVDASTTRAVGGTGLGLSITRSLVEMHGGRVWVESEVGAGSTFSFTIPLHSQSTQPETMLDLALDSGGKPVVLAIDDDEGVLNLYRRFLEKEGYVLVGLSNGANAVDAVLQVQPVAVMLDVMMPGRDGWEVITDLKLNPDTRRVPVILCTIVEDRERAAKLGAADYLVKPILEDDLLAALQRLGDEDGNGHMPAGDGADGHAVVSGNGDRGPAAVEIDSDGYVAAEQDDDGHVTVGDVLVETVVGDEDRADGPDTDVLSEIVFGDDDRADGDGPQDKSDAVAEDEVDLAGEGEADTPVVADKVRSVLVIDDDERFTEMVCERLQRNVGLSVRKAIGGQAGLEAIKQERPSMIVLDLMMPDVDGFKILAELDANSETNGIPVLLLTLFDLSPEDYARLTVQAVGLLNKEAYTSQQDLLDNIANALASI
jgi:signal transduction histidine kinase/CheY-like chemotaxis protein/nitrate/nitrite-specific signal transduction histidine kinase